MTAVQLEAIQRLEQQASVYRLLARLWQNEVDQTLLQQMAQPPIADILQEVGFELGDSSVDQLAEDFCAMFVGPVGHRIPSQSLWTEGKLVGDATARMGGYWQLVTDSASKPKGLADDHFGLQLEMMSNLIDSLIFQFDPENTAEDNDEVSSGLWEETKEFTEVHLQWILKTSVFYQSKAETKFYWSLVQVTGDFVGSELEFFLES